MKMFSAALEKASGRELVNSTSDYEVELRLIEGKNGSFDADYDDEDEDDMEDEETFEDEEETDEEPGNEEPEEADGEYPEDEEYM